MKKRRLVVLLLFGAFAVAALTCPKKDAHKEAFTDLVRDVIQDEKDYSKMDDLSIFLAQSLGSKLANYLLEERLKVKNYYVFSTGEIKMLDGESQLVSIGAFGHVFILKKKLLLSKLLSKQLNI